MHLNSCFIFQILNFRACVVYNLGNHIVKQELCLDDAAASDGQWHVLKVKRFGQEFILTMDGGEGRFYKDTFGHKLANNNFHAVINHLVAGAEVSFSSNAPRPIDYFYENCKFYSILTIIFPFNFLPFTPYIFLFPLSFYSGHCSLSTFLILLYSKHLYFFFSLTSPRAPCKLGMILNSKYVLAQLAGAVEYTDCISAEG